MKTDYELISSYRAGNSEAFREFYKRHSRALYFYLLSIVRDPETAEELLQDTFLAVLGRLEELENRSDLRPYLRKTSKNYAVDLLRRRLRTRRVLEAIAADPYYRCRESNDPLLSSENQQTLFSILRRLPDDQREVVVLRDLVGLTFQEITEVTGSPLGSVASRYRYGIEKLRAMAAVNEVPGRQSSPVRDLKKFI